MVRAEMHCMNTLPIWYSNRYLNTGANGNMWSLNKFNQTSKSAPGFDAFPPCRMKQDLGYEKEVLKQIMLKQEAIFVDQVSELHRLYRRQKDLMYDTERRQPLQCQMQPQHCSSQREPELAEKTVLGTTNLQPPSSSKWSQQLSSERKKPAKQMLDLELPADAYVDSEEGEKFEDKKVSEVLEAPYHPPKSITETPSPDYSSPFPCNGGLYTAYRGGNCRTDSLRRKDFGLFDLNGPVQVEEEETSSKNLGLMSNVGFNVQCPVFSLSHAKNQEPSERTNLALESSRRSQDLHLQNYPRSVSSCIRTSEQLVPPPYVAESEPSSLVSLRKPCGYMRHIPMAIQSLPCFKTPPSLNMNSKLSVGNQRISLHEYHLNGNIAASPSVEGISSLQNNLFLKSHLESKNLKTASLEANKETDRLTQIEAGISQAPMFRPNFDLNRLGYSASQNYDNALGVKSYMPSCQISPPASNSHLNWFREINNNEKAGNIGNGSDCLVTSNRDNDKPSGFGTLIDLNSCITEDEMTLECSMPNSVTKIAVEIDLAAPVSPENKEGSPPRGESEEHPIKPSAQLSKHEDRDPHGELVRIAAETLVTILSSEQLNVNYNCLLWFAGIISSVTNFDNDLELLPQGTDGFEVEAHACNGNGLKVKKEDATPLPSHQRKERRRRSRQWNDFQIGSLPCFAEGDLIEATGFSAETGLKRSAGKNRCPKGRRRAISSTSPSIVAKRRNLKGNEEDPCLLESCNGGWGKINRRKRGRRIATSNPYLIFHM